MIPDMCDCVIILRNVVSYLEFEDMSVKIYLAAPLFCEAELDYNRKLAEKLTEEGFTVILPQDLESDIEELIKSRPDEAYREIFNMDLVALLSCDVLVMVMDGRVPDEGACVELGIAYASGIECFGIKTDVRTSEYGRDNFMITGALKGRVFDNPENLGKSIRNVLGLSKD
ncbi:MAG: nucleoside 2-deoxyribosyltransferase [Candidatus Methanomethylophilaceae archaeon]